MPSLSAYAAETNAEKHAIGRADGPFAPVNANAKYYGEAYEHRQISDYIKREQVNLRIFQYCINLL